MNNIGGCLGGIAAALLSTTVPYWYSFAITISCHTIGYLFYAVVDDRRTWMMIIGRFLVGMFSGLQQSLAYTYLGVSFKEYISQVKESTKSFWVKDVLFALLAVSSGFGNLLGAGKKTPLHNLGSASL